MQMNIYIEHTDQKHSAIDILLYHIHQHTFNVINETSLKGFALLEFDENEIFTVLMGNQGFKNDKDI